MITPSKDIGTTKAAFESLQMGDVTKDYYNGKIWNAPTNIVSKFFFNLCLEDQLGKLTTMYPHHTFINKVNHDFEE